MPYCSRCGVEVDREVERCPLCEAPIQNLPEENGSPWPSMEAPAPAAASRSPAERLVLARTITTLGFLIPAFIVVTVDLFASRNLGWSLYVLTALGAAWLWAILPLIFARRPYLLIGAVTLVGFALEWGIGLLAGETDWVLTIGMPILSIAAASAALVVLAARRSKKVGSNLAGWVSMAVGINAITTDILVSAWTDGIWRPGWSLIVAGTVFPVAALLLYIHYRPSQRTRMRRYFHV